MGLAGVTPVYLLAQKNNRVYDTRGEVGAKQAEADAKALILQSWQERWQNETRSQWTRGWIETAMR